MEGMSIHVAYGYAPQSKGHMQHSQHMGGNSSVNHAVLASNSMKLACGVGSAKWCLISACSF